MQPFTLLLIVVGVVLLGTLVFVMQQQAKKEKRPSKETSGIIVATVFLLVTLLGILIVRGVDFVNTPYIILILIVFEIFNASRLPMIRFKLTNYKADMKDIIKSKKYKHMAKDLTKFIPIIRMNKVFSKHQKLNKALYFGFWGVAFLLTVISLLIIYVLKLPPIDIGVLPLTLLLFILSAVCAFLGYCVICYTVTEMYIDIVKIYEKMSGRKYTTLYMGAVLIWIPVVSAQVYQKMDLDINWAINHKTYGTKQQKDKFIEV